MFQTYTAPQFEYQTTQEQLCQTVKRHPVVIIGAGPVGLTQALDLAHRGIPSVVLDEDNTVSVGSRAVCYAKRTLEIWDRLGVGQEFVDRGIQWKVGKVFFKDDLAYQFDLLPEEDHKMPAMVNYQQYHLEERLVQACKDSGWVDLRWHHKILSLQQHETHVNLNVETPDGIYKIETDWLVACDGANSAVRGMVGAEFTGQYFQDRFLIADVVMKADFPTERWFWFDPPFHKNQSVLLHKQADNVWRIDFQLGWNADPVEFKKTENVIPLIKAMLGDETEFELEWVSVYQFACRRIDNFRHHRVLFAGDSAHQVSPFGARGANSGVQDCDNLGWKLQAVIQAEAPVSLLDSYHEERAYAADDNIGHSTRATDFITPKSRSSTRLRNAVLELAGSQAFARPLVNSGRLSKPTPYLQSSLNTPDAEAFLGSMLPGTNCADAPVTVNGEAGWFLNRLSCGFTLLSFGADATPVHLGKFRAEVLEVGKDLIDIKGLLKTRFDGHPGTVYLIRPDQHVTARWRRFDENAVKQAMQRALTFIN